MDQLDAARYGIDDALEAHSAKGATVMTPITYYLSSLDSERLSPVRECQVLRSITVGSDKPALVVRLSPAVLGQDFGVGQDLTEFVLVARFEGVDIRFIDEFPCFVFVARPLDAWDANSDQVDPSELEIIGWAEVYRTRRGAQEHRIG